MLRRQAASGASPALQGLQPASGAGGAAGCSTSVSVVAAAGARGSKRLLSLPKRPQPWGGRLPRAPVSGGDAGACRRGGPGCRRSARALDTTNSAGPRGGPPGRSAAHRQSWRGQGRRGARLGGPSHRGGVAPGREGVFRGCALLESVERDAEVKKRAGNAGSGCPPALQGGRACRVNGSSAITLSSCSNHPKPCREHHWRARASTERPTALVPAGQGPPRGLCLADTPHTSHKRDGVGGAVRARQTRWRSGCGRTGGGKRGARLTIHRKMPRPHRKRTNRTETSFYNI